MNKAKNQVLIVDDEPDIREVLELTLGRMNLETRTAANVDEAKHLLDEFKFDLCLTDMRLPDGNGIDLVRHIQEKFPYLPVAVITAFGNMETAIAAIRGELEKQGWRVPSVDDPVRPLQGGYYWMGLGEVIRLSPKGTSGEWEIYRQQNHWYKQLVEIHKDHAGTLFSVLGFGFALGMFILVVSGAFMMFQSPLYRKVATVLVIIGSIISVSAWIVSASS